jgi:hypothetical protein
MGIHGSRISDWFARGRLGSREPKSPM